MLLEVFFDEYGNARRAEPIDLDTAIAESADTIEATEEEWAKWKPILDQYSEVVREIERREITTYSRSSGTGHSWRLRR